MNPIPVPSGSEIAVSSSPLTVFPYKKEVPSGGKALLWIPTSVLDAGAVIGENGRPSDPPGLSR